MRAARQFLYSQVRIVAVMLLGCFVFAGCQSAPVTEAKPPSIKVAAASEVDAPRYTFGIIYPVAHLFYEEITRLTEEAAAPHSIRLIVKAPESFSADQQIHMMETMIQQQVDAIAIAPIDGAVLAPVIDRAVEAGIPVICFESDSPGSRRLSLIGTDNVKAGEQMGQVIQQLHNNKGMLLIESGVKSMKVNQERLEGLLRYLQDHTNIQVLEIRYHGGNSDKALSDLEQMIDDHPHFDSLVSIDLISSSTSVLVWKAKGLNRFALSFNMTPEMKEAFRNGQITSVISQHEQDWGHLLIKHLLRAAEGEPIPPFVDTDTQVVQSLSSE